MEGFTPVKNSQASMEFRLMVQPGIGLFAAVTRNSQRLLIVTVVFVSEA
jgi:hypothetical protein